MYALDFVLQLRGRRESAYWRLVFVEAQNSYVTVISPDVMQICLWWLFLTLFCLFLSFNSSYRYAYVTTGNVGSSHGSWYRHATPLTMKSAGRSPRQVSRRSRGGKHRNRKGAARGLIHGSTVMAKGNQTAPMGLLGTCRILRF